MKKIRLSLISVAALSTLHVDAQPLEEAIKNVDFSGFARYRYSNNKTDKTSDYNVNDLDLSLNFETKIDDNAKFFLGLMVAGDDEDHRHSANNGSFGDNNDNEIRTEQFYYQFGSPIFSTKLGRQRLIIPGVDVWYNGQRGDGITLDHDVGYFGMKAGYFNTTNLFSYGDMRYSTFAKFATKNGARTIRGDADASNDMSGYYSSSDLVDEADRADMGYLALMGSVGAVNLQYWGIVMEDYIDSMHYAQIDAKFGGFALTTQVNMTTLDDDMFSTNGDRSGDLLRDDKGLWAGVKLDYDNDVFGVGIGFTTNDEDQPIHSFSEEQNNQNIHGGYRLFDNNEWSYVGGETLFVDATLKFGAVSFDAGYARFEESGDVGSKIHGTYSGEEEIDEIWGGVSYAYSKNLNMYFRYSDISAKQSSKNEEEFYRYEIKYSF